MTEGDLDDEFSPEMEEKIGDEAERAKAQSHEVVNEQTQEEDLNITAFDVCTESEEGPRLGSSTAKSYPRGGLL